MEVSVEDEINAELRAAPHFVLLGAGASKAALPNGDKNGVPVPLLRDVAVALDLKQYFPGDLRETAESDFEAAYSQLCDRELGLVVDIDAKVREYFSSLELPDDPNLYDVLQLSLRPNDVIFTFNWDPFLLQSQLRLRRLGVDALPTLHFLHGNVLLGYCKTHHRRGLSGSRCPECREQFTPSRLLFPVEHKNYQDGGFIELEWKAAREYLVRCFMLTVFGYSAPTTDEEAIDLLKSAWGEVDARWMEEVEIINRPGANHDALRKTWKRFIHSHHYEIHETFFDSLIANHPRRTAEAFHNQFVMGQYITNNPVPMDPPSLEELVGWFDPLLEAERRFLARSSE